MVRVLVRPKCPSNIPRTKVREPLTREYLIEKTIPYDSYVARRMRELGVYDVGLSPTQIASVGAELMQVYSVKRGVDQKDVDAAIANAKMTDVNKNFSQQATDILKDIRDNQNEFLKAYQNKNESNVGMPFRPIETGAPINERQRLSMPQEIPAHVAVKPDLRRNDALIGELKQRLAQRQTATDAEQTIAEKIPALGKLKGQIASMRSGMPPAPPPLQIPARTPQEATQRIGNILGSMRERLMGELQQRLAERASQATTQAIGQPEDLPEIEGEPIAYRLRQRTGRIKYGKGMCGKGMNRRLPVAMPNPRIMKSPILHPMGLRV